MKNLTKKELSKAPHKVQFLHEMAKRHLPVGYKILEEAIKDHPEYFPDEIEHRSRFSLVPQQAHDDYQKEIAALRAEIYKDLPESKGILGWIEDPKGHKEWSAKHDECREKEKPLAKAIHDKHYGQYGIKWSGL